MDGDGGDAVVDDEDRCLGLLDLRRMKMDPRWMSSPSRSLLEVRFLRFLGVLYVVSPIQLHGAKLFEAAVPRATIRSGKIFPPDVAHVSIIFLCSMLVLHQLSNVLPMLWYTFYAFSGTNLLTR